MITALIPLKGELVFITKRLAFIVNAHNCEPKAFFSGSELNGI